MSLTRLLRRWLPLLVLVAVALLSWQAAQVADTDVASVTPVGYLNELGSPLISARRVPETLQAPIADDALDPAIEEFIAGLSATQPNLQSCLIVEVEGRQLVNEGANLALIPASNQKPLTTFAALEQFGPNASFTTRVATLGPIADGVLDGDLYLIGGGDPFLVTDNWRTQYIERDEGGNVVVPTYQRAWTRLEDLADDVAASGVTSVTGGLIADESYFDSVRVGPWAERLIAQNQAGPLSALSVNEGFTNWGADSSAFTLRTAAADPAANAVSVFAGLLNERGITVRPSGVGVAPNEVATIAQIQSPSLEEIVTHVNSWSNNYGAEILLKHLGVALSGEGSTVAGSAAVGSILQDRAGVDLDGIVIEDGSGLAETNRVTCAFLNDLLTLAGFDSPFAESLSIGGERGSLEGRHVDTDADGHVFAKTGTLNPSTALSGYIVSPSEPDTILTFSYISNSDFVDPAVRDFQEPFVEDLTTYPQAPPIEDLDPLDPVQVVAGS